VWYKTPTLTLGVGGLSVFHGANTDNGYFGLNNSGTAQPFAGLVFAGVPRVLQYALNSRIGVWTFYTCTWDGDKIRLYLDGVLGNTSVSYGPGVTVESWNAGTGKIAKLNAATYSFDGNLRAPFILNRCWSDADVAAYYNLSRVAAFTTGYGALVDLADQGGVVGAYL
jgi:hypothetical protein